MSGCVIHLAGQAVELLGDKLLWIPALRLLCASDIHFEKGSFFSRFATFLPPYDTEETLERLERAVALLNPLEFVALGDSFHDKAATERLCPAHMERLLGLIRRVPEWHWITGNHDPEIAADLPGLRSHALIRAGICFRHEADKAYSGPEISGHYHPKASVTLSGARICAPCFVHAGEKLILPSFGSYTGGLDIHDAAFEAFTLAENARIFLVHRGQVHGIDLP